MPQTPRPLAEAISAAGLTVQEAADALGLSRATLYSLIHEHAAIPVARRSAFADLLGVTEDEVAAMSHVAVPLVGLSLARKQGFTSCELSAFLGLSRYRVSACLNGHRPLPEHAAQRLGKLLGVDPWVVAQPDLEAVLADRDAAAVSS